MMDAVLLGAAPLARSCLLKSSLHRATRRGEIIGIPQPALAVSPSKLTQTFNLGYGCLVVAHMSFKHFGNGSMRDTW
jgi:hypothetical protein